MSLFRAGLVLVAVIMLLPADDKMQSDQPGAVARPVAQGQGFCERNPSTCINAREAWSLFLRKAAYGMELGARVLREQLARSNSVEEPAVPSIAPASYDRVPPPDQLRLEPAQQRRNAYQMDNPSRWR